MTRNCEGGTVRVLTRFRFQCINHVHRSFIVLSGHLMITVGGTGGFVRSKQVQQFRPQRFLDFRCKGLIVRESCFVSGRIVAIIVLLLHP